MISLLESFYSLSIITPVGDIDKQKVIKVTDNILHFDHDSEGCLVGRLCIQF